MKELFVAWRNVVMSSLVLLLGLFLSNGVVTQQDIFMGSEYSLLEPSQPLAAPRTVTLLLGSVSINTKARRHTGFGFS